MARINYLRNKSVEVGACSQTFVMPFLSDTKLQNYTFKIDYGNEDVTSSTALFTVATYNREEYNYQYAIYYQLPKNSKPNLKVTNWVLTLYYEDEVLEVAGDITQRILPNASSISNFIVYDEDGNVLPKDMFNRWIVSNKYEAGSRFTIRYDQSYPAYPSMWVNTNEGDPHGNAFIDSAWTEGVGMSKFEINEYTTGTDNQNIIFDFDDSWGIGNALTYVTFTRDDIQPITLKVNPNQLLNVDHSGGNFNFNVIYNNIDRSKLTIDTDSTWLDASWGGDNTMAVSIQANEDLTSVERTATIKIYGTNDDGIYAEAIVYISQIAMDIPYIGDAVETVEDYSGDVVPAIHTDYKGNVINDTGTFTFFNTKDIDGDDIIENVEFLINEEPTDFIKIEDIPDTRNSKIIAKDIYKYNYISEDVFTIIDVNVDLITGRTISYKIGIITEASPEQVIAPIWKDIFYECPKTYFRFKNLNTGDLLYNGMIYPDADNKIKINSILSTYIDINKYPFEKDINLNKGMIEAVLEISDSTTFTSYEEARIYHLYWNYSYDYNAPHTMMSDYTIGYEGWHSGVDIDDNFANPIEYYDPRQYIFISYEVPFYNYNDVNSQVYGVYNDGDNEILTTIEKGTIKGDIATIPVRVGDFDEIHFHIDAKQDEDYDKDYLWKVGRSKCTRAKYAVYYLNSYGIWCWMLFEGKQMESIKTTVNKYLNNNTNAMSYNIHNAVYQNKLDETYNLTSLYLKDYQSEKLKDLYTSPLIYVHELETDSIYNVYLNNTTYDIKKFNNQGRKFFTHNIKLVKSINKSIIV